VLAMGVHDARLLAIVLVPVGLAVVMSSIATRYKLVPVGIQLAIVIVTLTAACGLSTLYGPLVLVPTMIATFSIVLQAHPERVMRVATLTLAVIAIAAPVVLEWVGVIPQSWTFHPEGILIVPHMVELPRGGTIGLLLVGSIAMMVVPCIFMARLRASLFTAQRQLYLQAWKLERLADR